MAAYDLTPARSRDLFQRTRRAMQIKLVLLLSVVLVACGGGGSGTSSEPAVASAQNQVLVVAYGDSTQAGLNTATPQVVVPADIAQQALRAELGRDNISVVSAGVGGTNSQDLLDGTRGSPQWASSMSSSAAQVVTINHAINDASINRGTSDAQYRANLTQLVQIAKAAGKTVLLETPNPIVPGSPLASGFDLPGFARKVQIMRDVAAGTGATLCDEYAQIEQQGLVTLRWIPDGVHPHPALYQVKGQLLAECLKPMVQ